MKVQHTGASGRMKKRMVVRTMEDLWKWNIKNGWKDWKAGSPHPLKVHV